MAKRKPDHLTSVRLELQEKERDLIEQWQYLQTFSSIVDSLSKMKIETLYAWLTILEAFDLVDTPIPTVSDFSEIAAAFASWAKNGSANRQEEARMRDEYARNIVPSEPDPNYIPGVSPVPRPDIPPPQYNEDNYDPRTPGWGGFNLNQS